MRIAGVNIPDNKRLEVSLSYLYGIGRSSSMKILKDAGISPDQKAQNLSAEETNRLRILVEKYKIEGDLRREILSNIKRLKDIKTYRGIRHMRRLPVRGQRTRTNSRTVRGNVRISGASGKRKLEKK